MLREKNSFFGEKVWKTSSKKLLDKLTTGELTAELHARGIPTGGKATRIR